jgi:hypothetical protein
VDLGSVPGAEGAKQQAGGFQQHDDDLKGKGAAGTLAVRQAPCSLIAVNE